MTNEEMDNMVAKIYQKTKNIPGVDQALIRKCLSGIASLRDEEVEAKLKQLLKFI